MVHGMRADGMTALDQIPYLIPSHREIVMDRVCIFHARQELLSLRFAETCTTARSLEEFRTRFAGFDAPVTQANNPQWASIDGGRRNVKDSTQAELFENRRSNLVVVPETVIKSD